mgnify:CR=1 FL=1
MSLYILIFLDFALEINSSVKHFGDYICSQTLAKSIQIVDKKKLTTSNAKIIDIDDNINILIKVSKI